MVTENGHELSVTMALAAFLWAGYGIGYTSSVSFLT